MEITLKGKRAVITGASRGIGKAIAMTFAKAGAHVSICARGAEALEAAGNELGQNMVHVHWAAVDVSDKDAVKRYVDDAAKALGGLDILVNNASAFGMSDDEKGWEASITVDLLATVHASHAAVPHLEAAGGGAIVNISSISGFKASSRSIPYAATKAAVINLTKSQALTLAKKRIRVNSIAPGSIDFPGGIWQQRKTAAPAIYEATLKSIPWGRFGTPEEVASVALFLVSDMASWVTGQTIAVDGGQMQV